MARKKKESTFTVKCPQCGAKQTYTFSELPSEQPDCDKCHMPMFLDKVVAHA